MWILRTARALPLLVLLVAAACDVRVTIVEVHPAPPADSHGLPQAR